MAPSLEDLLSISSQRFSPSGESTIPPVTEDAPAEPIDTTADLPTVKPKDTTADLPTVEPKAENAPMSLDELLQLKAGGAKDSRPPAKRVKDAERPAMERFKFNKARIEEARKKQEGQLREFAFNKVKIGMRQFSLKFADTFSKNIDSVTTDPAAFLLNDTLNSGLLGLINPEEMKYFKGGGINMLTREFYENVLGSPIPDDLPRNAWTSAADEAATTGNILSIAKRGATIALKNPEEVVGKLNKAGQFVKKTVKGFGESLKAEPAKKGESLRGLASRFSRPASVVAFEQTGAVAAGVVGSYFEDNFPDQPLTKFLAQTAAGTTGSLFVPRKTVEIVSGLYNMGRKKLGGADNAVKERVQRDLEEGKDTFIKNLESPEALSELEGVSTSVQKTGSRLLTRIHQALVDQSDKLQDSKKLQLEEYNSALLQAAKNVGGDPSFTRSTLREQQAELKRALKVLVDNSTSIVDNKIKVLLGDNVALTIDEATEIASKEVQGILKIARLQESDLYNAIPDRVKFKLATAQETLQKELAKQASTSKKSDIPSYVTGFLGQWRKLTAKEIANRKKKGIDQTRIWVPGSLGKSNSAKELTVLRSRLLEGARIADAKVSGSNKARIMRNLAEGIRHGFSETPTNTSKEAAHLIALANRFSSDLHGVFTKGRIAPLLSKAAEGGSKVKSEDFLDAALLGKTGRKRRNMLKALRDDPAQFGNPAKLRAALEDYIKGDFTRKFVKDGALQDIAGAKRFMQANAETFEMYPKIADDLNSVIDSGDASAALMRRTETLSSNLGNPNISKTSLFIEKDPGTAFSEIRAIQDTRYNNVEKQTQLLLNAVNKDTSGRALHGLQAAFFQDIMKRASSGTSTVNNVAHFVDGSLMTHVLNDPATKVMAFKILNKQQLKRLEDIREAAVRLDISRHAVASGEGVIGNEGPAALLKTIVRIAGARTGSEISRITGRGNVQTPGLVSAQYGKWLDANVKDPIQKMIHLAFIGDDPEILALLLKDISTPEELSKASIKVGAWLASLTYNSGKPYTEKEDTAEDEQ